MKIFSNSNNKINLFFLIILFLSIFQAKSQEFHVISEEVPNTSAYKKAEFSKGSSNIYYFMHQRTFVSKSKVTAFRFVFDEFDENFKKSKILCASVTTSYSDSELKTVLDSLEEATSSCVGDFNEETEQGIYDGIIKLSTTKMKIGIILRLEGDIDFTGRVYFRIEEEDLKEKEQEKSVAQNYSLVPNTLVISNFRLYTSKILLYSQTRELQMYYTEGFEPYPEKLFSGNVLLIYTNPNQVRQKYKNANTMVLLTRPFSKSEPKSEEFQFEVKFFSSSYLLDYFVSNNLSGRSKNTPLMINMTECTDPYYVILNYNIKEKKTPLYIDQIYGKIKNIAVAPSFTNNYWDKMIEEDMKEIKVSERYYELPSYQENHIDVYKVECEIPLLLNFYFVEEQASIPNLDFGHVAIVNLKAYQTYTLPFASGVLGPILTFEVFNPTKSPFIIVDDGQNQLIISKNSLMKSIPMTTTNPIVLRERNGDSGTRVIIKVGYQISGADWEKISDNIYHNTKINLFVFYFPNNEKILNYTHALIETRGIYEGDNVKYCFSSSIGSPILPSAENCYRVSLNNSYTLKVLNPFVLYKDYDLNDNLGYYLSIKPVASVDEIKVNETLYTYDTLERNYEGESNVVSLNNEGIGKSILTAPLNKEEKEFIQITQCQKSDISFKLINAYFQEDIIIGTTTIPAETKNYFKIINNVLLETELIMTGNKGNTIFIRHSGVRNGYTPNIIENPSIIFNSSLNQLIIEHPLNNYERIEYTVYVGKEGDISKKDITLCSIAEGSDLPTYSKTVVSYAETASIPINFEKAGLKTGQSFEAIVYYEQKLNTKMAFLSDIIKGTVGEIKTDVITEINKVYSEDKDLVYASGVITGDGNSLYFSYMPDDIKDVPVGAFRIELKSEYQKSLSTISCAFVDESETPSGMIEAVEDIISVANPYCIGGKSVTDGKKYNYLFKYSYTKDNKPRRLVIKITNNQKIEDEFNIYLRKGENTYINQTNFSEQKEYGKREEYQKTLMPYIVDLELIRGKSKENYVSKLLLYSRYLEMQMYYLDETGESNMPILFFTGNIMLILTKPDLAIQKYHSTKLILLSESLNGQEHSQLGNNFRFHTKMFKSSDQIEYFQSNNPTGRTLNYPLSLEINTCSSENNKYYYILNYNRKEDERILYLDLLFGIINKARVIDQVNSYYWNELIKNDMKDINENMQVTLGENTQHIDVVEIQCQTPLLANAYYNKPDEQFLDLKKGNIAIKTLSPNQNTLITLDPLISGMLFLTISLYNPKESPDMTFYYGTGYNENIKGNCLVLSKLYITPESISVVNNGNSDTRFILKIGYGVEQESDWKEEKTQLNGALFTNKNKYVYKFPFNPNKRNFTSVNILVEPLKKDIEDLLLNTKFCYSTSIGNSIDVSKENCFRTGKNIPYTLTFINPLVAPKNYIIQNDEHNNYYITLSPFDYSKYISLKITENKYDIGQRSVEGIPSVLNFGNNYEKGIILSIPEEINNNKIFVQLQVCSSEKDNITYNNLNAYTKEEIINGKLRKNMRLFTYYLDNNKMETEINFKGYLNDKIFIKHSRMNNLNVNLEDYSSTWIESKNTVRIVKPIKNSEPFRITVLISKKENHNLEDYSLCTFIETPFEKYSTLGDYVTTFTSNSSDIVFHYIDFTNIQGYDIGQEFQILVYAVQINNTKIEVLYNTITGKVGKLDGFEEIKNKIPNKQEYATQLFVKNITSNNYLFYNFDTQPIGDIASIKIFQETDKELSVSKVVCTFVQKDATTEEMISAVNEAERTLNNLCVGESFQNTNRFDALINTKKITEGFSKLAILVKYGDNNDNEELDDINEDYVMMNITIRTKGYMVDKEDYEYKEEEELTLVPYVLDLKKIREMQKENYHSKVLVYSSTRELQMYYMQNGSPKELFAGNIMMIYTNEEVIKEKYNGASTMILLTDSLSKKKQVPFGEKFKFKVYFFNSAKTIQYYVSANENGRPLYNPTTIEMISCDQPYYYILNYNAFEGERMLHIDKIFGEINSTKFANKLTSNTWDSFISEMTEFKGLEYIIKGQNKYHIDVFEVTCNTPLLLNIYYTDEANPKINNLQQGDISILTLRPNTQEKLTFIENLKGSLFLYSFNVHNNYRDPHILIEFNNEDKLEINKNGIYIKNSTINYRSIIVNNKLLTGEDTTKIYFKFGYNIDETFTKIENDIYNIQTEERKDNIFAYIFKNGEDRLNYTKIDFTVSTSFDNVKFCYSTNLGVFINPSTQNCFRVGENNNYTISVMNPYIMHKDYFTGNDIMNYFVSFKTENKDLNITIIPQLFKYDTTNRNFPDIYNNLIINGENRTILTNPDNKEYLFVQMEICSSNSAVNYEFNNAFNGESLWTNGEINSGMKYNYKNIKNTKLDTELVIKTDYQNVNMFIKHTGLPEEFNPFIKKISIDFKDNKLIFNQPIDDEEFRYTILFDKVGKIKNKNYTLCSFNHWKMAYYTIYKVSSEREVSFLLDFKNNPDLKGYEDFEVLILAEELNNGKMMILSDIFSPKKDNSDRKTRKILIIVIIVLAVICIGGGVAFYLYLNKLKNRPKGVYRAKNTDINDIESTTSGQKLVESMSQSQADEV